MFLKSGLITTGFRRLGFHAIPDAATPARVSTLQDGSVTEGLL